MSTCFLCLSFQTEIPRGEIIERYKCMLEKLQQHLYCNESTYALN